NLFYYSIFLHCLFFFFSSRRRHTRSKRDWSSDVLLFRSLERIAIAPWVVNSNNLTVAVGLEYVPYQWDDRCTKDEGEDGGNLVEDGESIRFEVVGVATWHTHVANPVLNKERAVETDKSQPEVDLAQTLIQHTAGHLREPEVQTCECGEYNGTEDGVVEVRNQEVRLSQLEVQCWGCQHNAGHTTEQEGAHESHGP